MVHTVMMVSFCATWRQTRWLGQLLPVLLLAACGGGSHPAASQVAATVDKDEITVHQVNQVLQRAQGRANTPEQQAQLTGNAISALIDEQLFVRQALDHKLDRDPNVLARLEAARRQVLAQAYVEQAAGPESHATDAEISQYYNDNPALFSQRRVYSLQELIIPSLPPDKVKDLQARVDKAKSLTEISAWLGEVGVAFTTDAGNRSAEQLPLAALPRFAAMKDGEIGVFSGEGKTNVMQLQHAELRPVTLEQAKRAIDLFLENRKRQEVVAAELKRLRQAAKVEYVGEFAKYAPGAVAAVAPAAPPVAAPAKGGVTDKGVAGLH